MTQLDFNTQPLLLRRRELPGLSRDTWYALIEEGTVRVLQVRSSGRGERPPKFFYLRASLAGLLGLKMDWSEFESWPALVRHSHLHQCGLDPKAVSALLREGRLTCRQVRGRVTAFHKTTLARLVGYPI